MNSKQESIYQTFDSQLNCALDFKRHPVAVTFYFSQDEYESSTLKECVTQTSYCTMVRTAALGYARKARNEHVKCLGAKRALGFISPDERYLSGEGYYSLGLYKDIECAQEVTKHISIMKESIYGFSVQPLSSCDSDPDVIIFACDPNQGMRLVQGYMYNFGQIPAMRSMGNQGVCSELTVRPFKSQKINVSLFCSNTRYSCDWKDGELGVGISFSVFSKVVDGVIRTINSAESDTKKRTIAERADVAGRSFDIKLGTAYFSPNKIK